MHFASCVNQARFTNARNSFYQLPQEAAVEEREALLKEMLNAVEDELATAKTLYPLVKADSSIGYESSNHYFYIPQDILEKILNCRYLLKEIETMQKSL